jgi:tetratricopeptide (TPR) repeat protein
MTAPPASLAPALDRLRRGDLAGARAAVEAALTDAPDEPALLDFAGLVAAQAGDAAQAISHFRRALALASGNPATRINLATALIATGALDEAGAVCASGGDDPKLLRLAAYVHQQQGRLVEAAAAYDKVVAAAPGDFESWNNLGNSLAALGDWDRAAAAVRRAIALRPDLVEMVVNLSNILAEAERFDERRAMMREAARVDPGHAGIQVELGLAEAAMQDFEAAERAYREALRLRPDFTAAIVELGLLLETRNRLDDLEALIAAAPPSPERGFLHAWLLRRRGRFAEALPLAEAAPASISPLRRAQLLGELYDRLGEPPRAFAAFAEMNRIARAALPPRDGPDYRGELAARAALLTPARVAAWTPVEVAPVPPAPVFIVGFPRSGTTLLDTLLMNLPDLHILEELPAIDAVEAALGGDERLAALSSAEAGALRASYFAALEGLSPPEPGQRIVDKFPLHMARMPLIHRIFPDAKIVFAARHPCDAVLSCFMANFQLNRAMVSFTDLEEAALLYDAVLDLWTRATGLLPIAVHTIRYENMVADLEGEMRGLLDFLGIGWDPGVLDNRGAAGRRDYIRTASYAQVAEPIYARAAGRWESYRAQLAPVLPILAPWAERLGYSM